MTKNSFFIKKFFFSKCSYGHVQGSFDNPVENFLTKSEKFYIRKNKWLRRIFKKIQKTLPQKEFSLFHVFESGKPMKIDEKTKCFEENYLVSKAFLPKCQRAK